MRKHGDSDELLIFILFSTFYFKKLQLHSVSQQRQVKVTTPQTDSYLKNLDSHSTELLINKQFYGH
jgi:hypothetical protein